MSIGENDHARRRHRVLILAVLLAVVIGVGVAGAYLVGLAQRDLTNANGSGSSPSAESAPSEVASGSAADIVGDGTAATAPTDAELVQTSETASTSPLATSIDDLITQHFESINAGDYAAYAATVTNPLAEDAFGSAYVSTLDTDGLIHHISTDEAGSTQITLSFISQQSVELAPADLPSGCIAWTVVWNIDGPVEDLRVGASDSSKTQKEPCSTQ